MGLHYPFGQEPQQRPSHDHAQGEHGQDVARPDFIEPIYVHEPWTSPKAAEGDENADGQECPDDRRPEGKCGHYPQGSPLFEVRLVRAWRNGRLPVGPIPHDKPDATGKQ